MYCKHCGKQIADDSVFCQHCGESQTKEEPIKNVVPKRKIELTNKGKVWIGVYAVWFLLNLAAIFLKGQSETDYFFPWGWRGKWNWEVENYDISEFIVYALIVPIVAYGIYLFGKKHHWGEKLHKAWKWFVSPN